MNQNEWLDYFETVNGRKPSPKEFAQAKAAGEFTIENTKTAETVSKEEQGAVLNSVQNTAAPQTPTSINTQLAPNGGVVAQPAAKKKMSKNVKIVIASIVAFIFLIGACLGGYFWLRYESSKIDEGTWLIQSDQYYDKKKDKMVDSLKETKAYGFKSLDYLTVKGKEIKTYSYTDLRTTESVSVMDYETGNEFTYDAWNQTWSHILSAKEYEKQVNKVLDKTYKGNKYIDKDDIQGYKDDYIDNYKDALKSTYRYTVKGNNLTVSVYDNKNKLVARRIYKKITGDEEDKLLYDYDKAVKDDKELYDSLKD
ncbi:hypothetical protein [Streptococcus dentiloxodontae]